MKKKILLIAIVIMGLALSACGNKTQNASSGQEGNTAETQKVTLAEGVTMPNVVVETNKGTTFDLSTIEKPVLINFWATWCPPCNAEMPGLQNLYEKYGKDMDFILINLGESKETIQDFLIENEIYTFPIGYDQDQTYGTEFDIEAIPTTFIIGKDKKIKNYLVGSRDEADFKNFIEAAIKE